MSDQTAERTGFLFDGELSEIDPAIERITSREEIRQVEKLIMIASESAAPRAVREALATVFTDLYAEGYPAHHTSREPEDLIEDVAFQTAYHERYSDRRYYKGTEFADLVEALAQNRVRRLFAPNRYPHNPSQLGPDAIYANVQPLSGANANTAVYLALLQPGDTIMGLNLSHGGHLSHGSPANLSGRLYNVVAYGVDPSTGRIDYAELERLANEHQPRMIVSGASAYPWFIEWTRLRQICDGLKRRAYLMADISHPAGLVAAGLFPSPVGVADVTTFTTHKTLIGPRAAIILTTNESYARRIDRAVFPGLQGGPHMNTIAALAVAFKIGLTPEFDELQRTIVQNAKALSANLAERGLTIAYGGTESHLFLVDARTLPQSSGVPLNGDVAARILDLAGVVANKNTMLGDVSALYPRALRFGTPWITQRGLTPDDMRTLGGIIADVLHGIVTFRYFGSDERSERGKVRPDILRRAQADVADLIARRCIGPEPPTDASSDSGPPPTLVDGWRLASLYGRRVRAFLDEVVSGDVWDLAPSDAIKTQLYDADGGPLAPIAVLRRPDDAFGMAHFVVAVPNERYDDVVWWLKALSSGLVLFDPSDPWAKINGPVAVSDADPSPSGADLAALRQAIAAPVGAPDLAKPYFIGQRAMVSETQPSDKQRCELPTTSSSLASPLQSRWPESAQQAPDAWPMPRFFGDPKEELAVLRDGVGIVDKSGLGIIEIDGPDASRFLDLLTTNDLAFLAKGAAQYTFLLDEHGEFIADAIVYRFADDRYWLTTAPSHTPRAMTWIQEVLSGNCLLDPATVSRTLPSRVRVQDRRSPNHSEPLTCLGLAGPNTSAALRAVAAGEDRRRIARVRKFTHVGLKLAGVPVTLARTTHTGAAQGYEIYVATGDAVRLWDALLAVADPKVQPIGWDAWRSAGIAAGLPWDGADLGGPFDISPVQAGYGELVALHKPFFVGRAGLLARPYPPESQIARFTVRDLTPDTVTAIRLGTPIVDEAGVCVGHVTSVSAIASEPIGLGLVTRHRGAPGARLGVVDGAALGRPARLGEQLTDTPSLVTLEVLPRFPK